MDPKGKASALTPPYRRDAQKGYLPSVPFPHAGPEPSGQAPRSFLKGNSFEDVHELGQRRLKVELRVNRLRKQIVLLKTSHEEISKDVGLLMEFMRDFIGHERSGLTSHKDIMDMIRRADLRFREIDQHVAQVGDNATQITRVATVLDEMVQGNRYGGSVVGPNASVFDLFQGSVSKGEFQFFDNKVSELKQFNTQQSSTKELCKHSTIKGHQN